MNYEGDLWLRFAAVSELDGVDEPLTLVRRHGLHSGSDIIAWRDLRRVVEKALRATNDAPYAELLREQRAVTSGGLARSQALFGRRIEVVRTLAQSAPYSWCYLKWWRAAAYALARAFAPQILRRALRELRALRKTRY
jgi:hypothetical protein